MPRFVSSTIRRLRGLPRYDVELDVPSVFLGTDYGGYEIVPELLTEHSVVYSVGIGEDISFDLGLIEHFGCTVHGFDPTPRSLAWLAAQALPPTFAVHGFGLSDFDGTASFAPPKNPAYVSHSVLTENRDGCIDLPVKRLATVMRELEHDHLDVLKLDIEGAEYAVLDDMIAAGLLPRQLLVEFHHGIAGVELAKTEASLARLRQAGYRVFEARDSGREFSLLRGATAP